MTEEYITGYIDITDERGMPERISIEQLYQVFKMRLEADNPPTNRDEEKI